MFAEKAPTSTELAVWERPPLDHGAQNISNYALLFEGFAPIDIMESPFSSVRNELETKIVDQPSATNAIIEALERSEIRLPNDKRPIANLAFLGPTGVGKSETAKVLSQLLGDGAGNLVKIDCSNYSNGHAVSSLIGSSLGYIGSDKAPVFNSETVETEGTVVLFDEIEKGSPELYNLMLQIMGDGELRLNNGGTVSFRDTVIILTSNLGAKEMSAQLSDTPFGLRANKQAADKNSLEQTAKNSFEKFFAPEFINRLNKLVVFHPLSPKGMESVLELKLTQANTEYEKQLGIRLSLSDVTKAHLIDRALKEPHNGARSLIRALENDIQTTFGRYVGAGHIPDGTHVRVFHASEAPANYDHSGDHELIFTTKSDATIKRETQPPFPIFASAPMSPPYSHPSYVPDNPPRAIRPPRPPVGPHRPEEPDEYEPC